MLSSHIEKTSKAGPAAALNMALKTATDNAQDFSRTNIFLKGIESEPEGWRARLNILAEPKKNRKESAPEFDWKPVVKDQAEQDEQEYKERELVHRQQLEEFYHGQLIETLSHEYDLELQDYETLILYVELEHEGVIREIAPQYDFTAIHVLPEGSLSRAAERSYNLEFYEIARGRAPQGNIVTWDIKGPEPEPE